MKPVRLTIEGINSFTDEQTLDFEAAGRDNLFCISGKTGAGKTTIFDCILLALYGKCSRGNLGDVINLSRKDARVTFEFEANGDTYFVERTIKRTKKKSNASADKAELADRAAQTDAQADPTDAATADEKGGGKGKAAERSAPMSTGTGKCVLKKNGEQTAIDRENDALAEIVGLTMKEFKNVYLLEQGEYAEFLKLTPQQQLETVGKIFSLERFADVYKLAHARQTDAASDIEKCEAQIGTLGEDSPAELKALKAELAALKARNTALDKEIACVREELDAESRRRDDYMSAVQKANNAKRLAISLDDAKRVLDGATAERDAFLSVEDGSERAAAELRERVTELVKLGTLDDEYAGLADEHAKKLEFAAKKRAEAQRVQAEKAERQRAADAAKSELAEATAELVRKLSVGKRSAATEKIIRTFAEPCAVTVDSVTEMGYAVKNELAELGRLKESENKEREARDGYVAECEDCLKKTEFYASALNAARAEREAAQKAEESAQSRLAHAQKEAHAAAVRAELAAGDRCPVCGGVYGGGHAEGGEDVERCKQEYAEAKKACAAATDNETKLQRAADDCKAAYDRADAERKKRDGAIAELRGKLDALGADETAHEDTLERLRKMHALAEAVKVETEKAAASEPEISKLAAECDAAERAAAECAKKSEKLEAELGEYIGKTKELIADMRGKLADAEQKAKAYNDKKSELNTKLETAKAAVAAIGRELAAAQADCPIDMPEFDEEKYAERKSQFDGMTKEFHERETEIAVKNNNAEGLAQKCEEIKKISAERAEHVKRHDIYKKISELTRNKAMLNFVAEEYVYEFTAAASKILGELSGGKYSMSFDATNGFLIYDYLNDGKARKSGTLSGGELFLASLAVAISIADAQSKGDNAFFFLDEGFGTLDDELIDTVFGALSALSANCLVGVITHAGALIERMPIAVSVEAATDTEGSKIACSAR